MTMRVLDGREEARADLRRSIAEAREGRSLPSLTAFEGALVRALRVAQDGLAIGSVERQDVDLVLAMYDDGMETLLYRAQARGASEAGEDIESLVRTLRSQHRGGHALMGGAA